MFQKHSIYSSVNVNISPGFIVGGGGGGRGSPFSIAICTWRAPRIVLTKSSCFCLQLDLRATGLKRFIIKYAHIYYCSIPTGSYFLWKIPVDN